MDRQGLESVKGAAISVKSRSRSALQRIPELDGLRGLAILLVIICHYFANAEHKPLGFFLDHVLTVMTVGWSGVDLFFVLSGFLIGGILLESRDSPRYFQTFYLRRVFRILPIYYLWIFLYALLVSGAVYLIGRPVYLAPDHISISAQDFSAIPIHLLFLQNIIYSPTRFEWIWFTVTWSLAIEEQFYLVAPPLIRFLSRKTLTTILIAVVLLAPVLRAVAFLYLQRVDHFYQFGMPCRADALSLGILAALAWRWDPFRRFLADHPGLVRRIFLFFGLGVVGLLWWLVRPANLVMVTIGYSWLGLFYASLLLLVLSQRASILAQWSRWKWLGALGGISYAVYMIHLTINHLAHRLILHADPEIYQLKGVAVTLFALLLTLSLAMLSWRFFEKPLIRRGHKYVY